MMNSSSGVGCSCVNGAVHLRLVWASVRRPGACATRVSARFHGPATSANPRLSPVAPRGASACRARGLAAPVRHTVQLEPQPEALFAIDASVSSVARPACYVEGMQERQQIRFMSCVFVAFVVVGGALSTAQQI